MQRISCTISDKAEQALNEMSEKTKLKKSTIVECGIFEMYEKLENENFLFESLLKDYEKYGAIDDIIRQLQAEKEKVKELEKSNFDYNIACTRLEEYIKDLKQALEEIKGIAILIIKDDDKPTCVNDEDCPLNSGAGFDNHCSLKCPYVLTKQILEKCDEVLDE